MYTIGIYPRKSVYRDNSDSVAVQVQLCKDYAGIVFKDRETEFRVYDRDEGFSGKNTNRPSFREMMEDVENGVLDAVMVYKLDRISRNVQEFSAMYEVFQRHNVSFISVKESFDTGTPMGRTVMYILAAFAQLEREKVELDGLNARSFASQGQTRTAALSLKLAAREIHKEIIGEYPILLLDDVLSELDPRRQEYVLNRLGSGQVFITCCEEDRLATLLGGQVFHVEHGKITC